jgi:hypothetical protein
MEISQQNVFVQLVYTNFKKHVDQNKKEKKMSSSPVKRIREFVTVTK